MCVYVTLFHHHLHAPYRLVLDRYGFSSALAVINTLLALSSVLILIPILDVQSPRVNPRSVLSKG